MKMSIAYERKIKKKVSKENSQGREQDHPERSKEGTAEYNQSYMIKCEGKTKEREEEEKTKKRIDE